MDTKFETIVHVRLDVPNMSMQNVFADNYNLFGIVNSKILEARRLEDCLNFIV